MTLPSISRTPPSPEEDPAGPEIGKDSPSGGVTADTSLGMGGAFKEVSSWRGSEAGSSTSPKAGAHTPPVVRMALNVAQQVFE